MCVLRSDWLNEYSVAVFKQIWLNVDCLKWAGVARIYEKKRKISGSKYVWTWNAYGDDVEEELI